MAFWKENQVEPTRQFRFQIIGGEVWWWVKNLDKPSFEINTNEYLLINHKFKYPGVLTWNDITISLVDTGGKVQEIMTYIENSFYSPPSRDNITGIKKDGFDGNGNVMQIQQLDAKGEPLEDWHLYGAFIKSFNTGKLDYSSDELVELQLVISYDYATLGGEGELEGTPENNTPAD